MFSAKRTCPFQNEHVLKKQCTKIVEQRLDGILQKQVVDIVSMDCDKFTQLSNPFQEMETDRDLQPTSSHSNPAVPSSNNMVTNNTVASSNNTYSMSSPDCDRCHAGEPGHYGHIGR